MLNVRASLSASVALTLPVTTLDEVSGVPTVVVPATGTAFLGLIATDTATGTVPPYPSVTVTVNVSVLAAVAAPIFAAAWRAVAVGV